jgi:hypothetical protein
MAEETEESESIQDSLQAVYVALEGAAVYGWEAEVVTWALQEMKANPALTISQAIHYGFEEWVK